jgi:hypothetical protein
MMIDSHHRQDDVMTRGSTSIEHAADLLTRL